MACLAFYAPVLFRSKLLYPSNLLRICVSQQGQFTAKVFPNPIGHGDDAEEFEIVDGHTGASLWHFNVGQPLHVSPMSYAVNGKQYFAICRWQRSVFFCLAVSKAPQPHLLAIEDPGSAW